MYSNPLCKIPLTSFHHCTVLHIPPFVSSAPLRCHDSFVTKMNSSSALQPKQVIWLPRPQIKLVWFNFRFGLLLQPYIKADIFHYTAKVRVSRQQWPTPPHRKTSQERYGIYLILLQVQEGWRWHWCHWWACYPQGSTVAIVQPEYLDQCLVRLWQCAGRHGCRINHMRFVGLTCRLYADDTFTMSYFQPAMLNFYIK